MADPLRVISGELSLANWTQAIKRSALQDMLVKASDPKIISFALGLPAPELFPKDALMQAAARVLVTQEFALQYQPPIRALKTQVVALMAERGVTCNEEQVFLTAGAQQGMGLLARLLLDPGGSLITEEMTYTGFQQIIEPFQARALTVTTDRETGMNVDEVEALLRKGARPAFIYSVTDGHNPLGVSLSHEKRARLVDIARHYCVPIIEDDAYGFLSYDGKSMPPMRALDDEWVFYVGSFSKILAPALRAGWLIVPQSLMRKLSVIKEASDIDTTTFAQRMISAYLETGQLADHLLTLRREYAARRDAMLQVLSEYFPAEARWHKPANGVFIWVELDSTQNASELLGTVIEQEQVAFIPGQAFCVNDSARGTNCMRLNFSNSSTDRIEEGIKRLARALNKW